MQIVYITNRRAIPAETLAYVEHRIPFVDQAVFVCPAELRGELRFSGRLEILTLDELEVLGRFKGRFLASRDHQVRNWLLRAALATTPTIDDEFLMSDDDSRPLAQIAPETFKENGRYHAYTSHDLLRWRPTATDYDRGQRISGRLLAELDYPHLSYSAHMPQIMNKRFLAEAVNRFEPFLKEAGGLDEWSTYFNFARGEHPESFHPPRPFRTLCWPARPSDWEPLIAPSEVLKEPLFENFYPELYAEGGLFEGLPTAFVPDRGEMSAEKIRRRQALQRAYDAAPQVHKRRLVWFLQKRLQALDRASRPFPKLRRTAFSVLPAFIRDPLREVFHHGDDPARWFRP